MATADARGRILEIGPSYNPTVSRGDGFDTKNADHTTRAGLIDKYRQEPNVDVSRIEDVDYVLTPGTPMSKCIDERFDLVLAAHVLEHSVSLVDFINDCVDLLRPGGTLALIVPDHRYCFDRFRERSSLSAVIDAARSKSSVHSIGVRTEQLLNAVKRANLVAWGPATRGDLTPIERYDVAVKAAAQMTEDGYEDAHHWVFTPHHLRLLLHDLHAIGYIRAREVYFHDTVGCEFYLNLQVDGPGSGLTREELVERSDAERRPLHPGRLVALPARD